jgi:hypothetical protein
VSVISDDEAAAQLCGAIHAWIAALRPAVRAIDGLADRPHSRTIRDALALAAHHIHIAATLLEATADAAEPHRSPESHQLDEEALRRRLRAAAL